MDDLASWGHNLVRLGVMWEGYEKAPGVYDEQYLLSIEKVINKLGERGIYTMIDIHQDGFSRMTCGEGVPDHVANSIL